MTTNQPAAAPETFAAPERMQMVIGAEHVDAADGQTFDVDLS